MPRYLGKKDNTVKMMDGISGAEIEFRYRLPTIDELQDYFSSSVVREPDGKTKLLGIAARVTFAKTILTGIRDGDFIDENGKAISSNPESPEFRTDWAEMIAQDAPDLLNLFVLATFDRTVIQTQENY